jgi:hypothetical protein
MFTGAERISVNSDARKPGALHPNWMGESNARGGIQLEPFALLGMTKRDSGGYSGVVASWLLN